MKIRICKYCNKSFTCAGRVFSNHVRWCPKNITNADKGVKNIRNSLRRRTDLIKGPILKYTVICDRCSKEFEIEEREADFPSKARYYCTRKCANTKQSSPETNEKIRAGLLRYCTLVGRIKPKPKFCEFCNDQFTSNSHKQRFCSGRCSSRHRYSGQLTMKKYRLQCAFEFSINTFPAEFDFDLIKTLGWYSPSNKKNNLSGISRDHKFSIRDGFTLNIDPEIIKHPANCQLIPHPKNLLKNAKSDITLEELLVRIEEWNKKYPLILV